MNRAIYALLLAMLTLPVGAGSHQRLDVIILHSYHQDYPWTSLQHEGFSSTLSQALPEYDIYFSSEHLDTKRVEPSTAYLQKFLSYLQAKYRDATPDLIYVTDDNAMNFILAEGAEWYRAVPVIFSGVNNLSLAETLDRQRISGVFERKRVQRSIELIQRIRPQTKRIIFMGDGGPTDQAIGVNIREASPRYAAVDIVHIGKNSRDELLKGLQAAGSGVVVVTTIGGVRNENGQLLELAETMKNIIDTGRMVLIMEDAYFSPGVLGGYVTAARLQGEAAAHLAARIFQNETVSTIDPIIKSPGELVFDWKVLQDFSMQLDADLLNEAKIINQPLPVLDRHPLLLRWALGLFIVISLIVITTFILVTRNKNRLIIKQATDDLTGLPNRTRMLQHTSDTSSSHFAVIDINDFKAINSIYGLNVGDDVLVVVSQEIARLLPGGIGLYRMGRDQFGVLASQTMDFSSFKQLIANIIEAIKHLSIGEAEIHLTASAGISGHKSTSLIAGAEQALHLARDRNEEYAVDEGVQAKAERQKQNIIWANKLSVALDEGRIRPFFQPIIHNATGKSEKYEALVRLIDEDGSIVTPFRFLEAAKRTRQYAMLTRTMIDQSFRLLSDCAITISLNLSVEDIRNPETVRFFKQKLDEYQVAERVVVELTESEGIENYNEISNFIAEIKAQGCRVAIDDFGAGYSNFTHLIHLNADYLKIDGSIIKRIHEDKKSELVTRTLVDFARRLGMETIAEFVHSQAVLDKVIALGVDYSQGFFLGEPAPDLSEGKRIPAQVRNG